MAHSLFEPHPQPLTEKIWQRVKDINDGLHGRMQPNVSPVPGTDPALLQQANALDARGRQQLLQAVLKTKPI